jgi:NADH:ubiquinone oxidoreductase subunit 6 (subunit J)
VALGLALLGLLSKGILEAPLAQVAPMEGTSTIQQMGVSLMTTQLLPFEMAGILLLGALIAAAGIASGKKN